MCKFLSRKLKRKVIRETFLVPFNRLNQNFRRNSIKFCKLLINQDFFTANQENKILNPLNWNQFNSFIHVI